MDHIFNALLPLHYLVAAPLLGLSCWALSAVPLVIGGQMALLDSMHLMLGGFGIAMCTAFTRWGTLRYQNILQPVQIVLEDDSIPIFNQALGKTLHRMSSISATIGIAVPLWAIGCISMIASWFHGLSSGNVVLFDFMPAEWYLPEGIGWRLAAVVIMAFPVGLIVWTGGRMLLLHTFLILTLRHMQFISSPTTCIRVLRPALTFGVVAAFFWALGIALFGIALRERISPNRIVFFTALSTVGTFGFVVPILGLRSNLLRVRQQRMDRLTKLIVDKVKGMDPDPALIEEVSELERRAEESAQIGPVLMGWRYLAWFVTVVLVPACFVLLQFSVDKLWATFSSS